MACGMAIPVSGTSGVAGSLKATDPTAPWGRARSSKSWAAVLLRREGSLLCILPEVWKTITARIDVEASTPSPFANFFWSFEDFNTLYFCRLRDFPFLGKVDCNLPPKLQMTEEGTVKFSTR